MIYITSNQKRKTKNFALILAVHSDTPKFIKNIVNESPLWTPLEALKSPLWQEPYSHTSISENLFSSRLMQNTRQSVNAKTYTLHYPWKNTYWILYTPRLCISRDKLLWNLFFFERRHNDKIYFVTFYKNEQMIKCFNFVVFVRVTR